MGADGHITIWRDEKVREAFPDCDELFGYLSTHYTHELDGVTYHHCYHGDNLCSNWAYEEDWYFPGDWGDEKKEAMRARLEAFTDWLASNGTEWEVWT